MHTLVGGGGQLGGFDALDYRKIKQGDAGKLGNYPILAYLPDKFARFLYEFHSYRFESLDLPPLPADSSDLDVHGARRSGTLSTSSVPYYSLLHLLLLYSLCIVFHIIPIMTIILFR